MQASISDITLCISISSNQSLNAFEMTLWNGVEPKKYVLSIVILYFSAILDKSKLSSISSKRHEM